MRTIVGLVLAAALMAGCAESPASAGTQTGGAELGGANNGDDQRPKAGRAGLIVVVTTSELQPVSGAQVLLADTSFTMFTDEGGRAVFNDLDGGSYTALTAKPGFRAAQPKGRVVNLVPDEFVEAKLELDPVPVVEASNSYYSSVPYKGFLSCSLEYRTPGAAQAGRTSPCRGVPVGGQMVGRDPNENSIHPWVVDNIQVQTILLEATWRPSMEAAPSELFAGVSSSFSCSASACTVSTPFMGAGGKSPLVVPKNEAPGQGITAYLGREVAKYPRNVWTEVRSHCSATCNVAPTVQQGYELWISVFYGQEAPAGFTALAK